MLLYLHSLFLSTRKRHLSLPHHRFAYHALYCKSTFFLGPKNFTKTKRQYCFDYFPLNFAPFPWFTKIKVVRKWQENWQKHWQRSTVAETCCTPDLDPDAGNWPRLKENDQCWTWSPRVLSKNVSGFTVHRYCGCIFIWNLKSLVKALWTEHRGAYIGEN
jgi:hypothetical protein